MVELASSTDSNADTSLQVSLGATALPEPKRGSRHPILQHVYVGGCALDINYRLVPPNSYKSVCQLHSEKGLLEVEKMLCTIKDNVLVPKFDGKLTIPKDHSLSGKELDKVDFIRKMKSEMNRFGLQTFFYVCFSTEIKCIIKFPHHFSVESVTTERNYRLLSSSPICDNAGVEMSTSKAIWSMIPMKSVILG